MVPYYRGLLRDLTKVRTDAPRNKNYISDGAGHMPNIIKIVNDAQTLPEGIDTTII